MRPRKLRDPAIEGIETWIDFLPAKKPLNAVDSPNSSKRQTWPTESNTPRKGGKVSQKNWSRQKNWVERSVSTKKEKESRPAPDSLDPATPRGRKTPLREKHRSLVPATPDAQETRQDLVRKRIQQQHSDDASTENTEISESVVSSPSLDENQNFYRRPIPAREEYSSDEDMGKREPDARRNRLAASSPEEKENFYRRPVPPRDDLSSDEDMEKREPDARRRIPTSPAPDSRPLKVLRIEESDPPVAEEDVGPPAPKDIPSPPYALHKTVDKFLDKVEREYSVSGRIEAFRVVSLKKERRYSRLPRATAKHAKQSARIAWQADIREKSKAQPAPTSMLEAPSDIGLDVTKFPVSMLNAETKLQPSARIFAEIEPDGGPIKQTALYLNAFDEHLADKTKSTSAPLAPAEPWTRGFAESLTFQVENKKRITDMFNGAKAREAWDAQIMVQRQFGMLPDEKYAAKTIVALPGQFAGGTRNMTALVLENGRKLKAAMTEQVLERGPELKSVTNTENINKAKRQFVWASAEMIGAFKSRFDQYSKFATILASDDFLSACSRNERDLALQLAENCTDIQNSMLDPNGMFQQAVAFAMTAVEDPIAASNLIPETKPEIVSDKDVEAL